MATEVFGGAYFGTLFCSWVIGIINFGASACGIEHW
jgi:hypothetical protein